MATFSVAFTDENLYQILHRDASAHPLLTVAGVILFALAAWKYSRYLPVKILATVCLLAVLFWVFIVPQQSASDNSAPKSTVKDRAFPSRMENAFQSVLGSPKENEASQTFSSESGRFSVSVPTGRMKQEAEAGVYSFTTDAIDDRFTVEYAENPDSLAVRVRASGGDPIDGFIKDLATKLNTEPRVIKDITLGSFAGKEYRISYCPRASCENENGLFRRVVSGRVFLVGIRLYHVSVDEPVMTINDHDQQAMSFLDSFRVWTNESTSQ